MFNLKFPTIFVVFISIFLSVVSCGHAMDDEEQGRHLSHNPKTFSLPICALMTLQWGQSCLPSTKTWRHSTFSFTPTRTSMSWAEIIEDMNQQLKKTVGERYPDIWKMMVAWGGENVTIERIEMAHSEVKNIYQSTQQTIVLNESNFDLYRGELGKNSFSYFLKRKQ